jgi:cytochrome c biogenesis protein CcdA
MSSLPLPAAAFVGGLVSFLSPCVLPLVPGYVSLVSGTGVEELRHSGASSRRSVAMHSLLFVLGFSVVFVALGAIASSVGQLLGQHLSLLTRVAGSIVVILGLHRPDSSPSAISTSIAARTPSAGAARPEGRFSLGSPSRSDGRPAWDPSWRRS